jgi:regulator of protease activity HflC (stomatin/prohibitin superfamily)
MRHNKSFFKPFIAFFAKYTWLCALVAILLPLVLLLIIFLTLQASVDINSNVWFFTKLGLIIAAFAWIITVVVIIIKGLEVVNENWKFMFSVFGDYQEEWGDGLHWRFPLFGITSIDAEVFLGDQFLEMGLGDPNAVGGGKVDFIDESASLDAFLHYQIVDPYKAVYGVADLVGMIAQEADAALRSFLALYTIEDANELKSHFSLENISTATKVLRDQNGQAISAQVSAQDFKNSDFYKSLMEWGVKPKAFIIRDIEMPERIILQRRRALEADMDLKVAKVEVEKAKEFASAQLIKANADRKTTVEVMTGKAEGTERLALAMAKQIKDLMNQGMSAEKAADYLLGTQKAEAMKTAEKLTYIENSSAASQGAAFGSGFNS